MTVRSAGGAVEVISARRSRLALPAALPYRRAFGLLIVAVLVIVAMLLDHPALLDLAVLVPVAALAGAAVGGVSSGVVGAFVGEAYLFLYYSQPSVAAANGGIGRVVASIAASAVVLWLAAYMAERSRSERAAAAAAARRSTLVSEFAAQLADEPAEDMPNTLVRGAATLLRADMAVLTMLDPYSGRHFVRAAFGGSSVIGVEVTPGFGVTGRAIQERRVAVGYIDPTTASGLNRRLRGNAGAQSMAAVASVQSGRVIASLTVGRADGTPFGDPDQRLLDAIGSVVTLALASSLAHGEVEQSATRDQLTGLYTRAYMEAALEQLLALRRREPAEERAPLSVVLLDVDGLRSVNQHYGPEMGDRALRSVATLLLQRFRQSDIVARMGIDEFVIVLTGATPEIADEVASQIKQQVDEMVLTDTQSRRVPVAVSVGCGLYRDGEKAEELIAAARTALEAGRRIGPRPVRVASTSQA